MATYGIWQGAVQDTYGNALVSASVEVRRESDNGLATVFSTRTGTSLTNPFTSDSNGMATFYAAPGLYKITVTKGSSSRILRYVNVGIAGDVGDGWSSPAADTLAAYTAGVERIRVSSAGAVTIGGALNASDNVGAGVDANLNLGAGRTGDGNAYVDLSASVGVDYSARFIRFSGANGVAAFEHVGTGTFSFTNKGAAAFVFATTDTERMRLTSGGDFGVGTNSPASRLDARINGGASISGPSSGTWVARIVNATDSSAQNGLSVQNRWGTSSATIFECASGWNGSAEGYYPVFSVKGDGLVGVGTSSPSTQFHVVGPIRCGSYTVGTVPSASSAGAGARIYVTNEAGGAVGAESDGADWRRVTDRAIIS